MTPSCKLLYVTPEQLCKNGALQGILADLHARALLARLVIDEVGRPGSHPRLSSMLTASPRYPAHAVARLRTAGMDPPVMYSV